jgi:exopolyphosphatase/guanosine-5'-triphosphate,3'-diphosphate pyrophosphatase
VRLAILDVGSNTVHLLVVDAEPSARPTPAGDQRWDSPLLHHRGAGNEITETGQRLLIDTVQDAHDLAEALGVHDFSAFATSAMRDTTNVHLLLDRIEGSTGVRLQVVDGDDEARLTFLAARRWLGWGSGRLLAIDIGGGSLELAIGIDEVPEEVVSLPLGANTLTREFLRDSPPRRGDITRLRRHVQRALLPHTDDFASRVDMTAGTSKTMRSLARLAGAAPSSDGLYANRTLRRSDAEELVDKLAALTAKERAKVPGVSPRRAAQLLAGAIVAAEVMRRLGVDSLSICPWALREGVILTRHAWIVGG